MIILKFILGLQSQITDFKNSFYQADILEKNKYSLKLPGI